ncbi:uncharacterized protein LOC141686305 [Apium graveolens]|uniref:uncharacterized protein LOC141686305 n=1 Tax=Apium graveolens TaxID=4045 RepID=UPI003D7903CC
MRGQSNEKMTCNCEAIRYHGPLSYNDPRNDNDGYDTREADEALATHIRILVNAVAARSRFSMTNITSLSFVSLDIYGDNYLSWVQDVKLHLGSKKLSDTIKAENKSTAEENFTSIIFLLHHMHEDLKSKYLEVEDPFILWKNLKDRFDHQKLVYLPAAENDWANLRLQDFKSVRAYSSASFKISSRLIMCGEKVTEKRKIDKTLSTFHPNNINLAEMYRERKFTKFGDLLSTLLVAEQNHELVIKNHQSRPTGSAPLPEVNNM